MKKIIKAVFILISVMACTLLTVRASAVGEEIGERGTYTVTENADGYVLYSGTGERQQSRSLNELVASIQDTECTVSFENVVTDSSIELSYGSYTFSGSLAFAGNASLTVDGATLELSGASLTFSEGSLRIKRGSVDVISGNISSTACAVLMDFSASSTLNISGGGITSDSGVALSLVRGAANISGGSVTCKSGAAIESSSTLTLSGSPVITGSVFDIITDTEITLFSGDEKYSGRTRVKFLSEFERGVATPVVYALGAESLLGVELYDLFGASHPLSFMTAGQCNIDESCGAVRLPYIVSYFNGDECYATSEYIRGEVTEKPSDPYKIGYDFLGWYSNRGELFDSSVELSSDVSVYAKYELMSPSYTVISDSFVYDGKMHTVSVTDITHPILESGFLSYEWYKNGVPLNAYSESINIMRVSDSGEYSVKIIFTVGSDIAIETTPAASVTVLPAPVYAPTLAPVTYTGSPIFSGLSDTDEYIAESVSGTLVGTYPVALTLKDSENHYFVGADADTVYVDFIIERAENGWQTELSISDIYTSGTLSPHAAALFGEVTYLFSERGAVAYYEAPPTQPGKYTVKAIVAGTENYTGLESPALEFNIIAEHVEGISVKTQPDKLTYIAFEHFSPSGIEVIAMYNSGRLETVYENMLSFSYQSADSFRFGDSGVTVSYGGKSVTLRITVEKAEYDMSGVTFPDASITYNGSLITLPQPENLPVGMDGIELRATVSGGGALTGSYNVTLSFLSESRNYKIPENMTATLTVLPCERTVVWGACEFIYDGTAKLPGAFYLDIYGRRVSLSPAGARSLAGEYVASVVCSDKNYTFLNPECTFVIAKASYDMSGVLWQGGGEVYDGIEKSVFLTSLPDGVSVKGYVNNKATSCGNYIARAALSYDSANYNAPEAPEYEWSILPASYSTEGFSFSDVEATFDGQYHYPLFLGSMPVGIDGITLEYSFSRGVRDVKDGNVPVVIIFSTRSSNYLVPEPMTAHVSISPKEITVNWGGLNKVYNEKYQVPTATAPECSVTVTGGGVNAGKYSVTATSDDPNYVVGNATSELVIDKAPNTWIYELSVSDIFYGRLPKPTSAAKAGEITYVYYSAESPTQPLGEIPRAVGDYLVVALSEGDRNHYSISSAAMQFSIIAVVPTALDVRLTKNEYAAFESLGDRDVTAYLVHNDGTAVRIPHESLTFDYTRDAFFLFGDSSVTVSYAGFSSELSVSVVRADYDMSGVRWENTLAVYDGTEKSAQLTGLPSGVYVKEYVGNSATLAGEYPIRAYLGYDSDNYNPPVLPEATLRIAKMTLSPPEIPIAVYDGTYKLPEITESRLYVAELPEPSRLPGRYAVTFYLSDSDNYEFTGGKRDISVDFVISKIPITVTVDDVTLNLFESSFVGSFEISSGELLPGDELVAEYFAEDGKIYALFDTPYYEVTVIPGALTNTGRPSEAFLLIFFIIIIILLIVLTVYILARRRLLSYVSQRTVLRGVGAELPIESEPAPCESDKRDSEELSTPISAEYADSAISNSLAKDLIRKEETVVTYGWRRGIINVDTLSGNFSAGERVDVNILKRKSLVPYDTAYIKVLARGVIDKPLHVYANDFSLSAVKMIALSGGRAIKVNTTVNKTEKNDEKP